MTSNNPVRTVEVAALTAQIIQEVSKAIVGKTEVLEKVMAAFLSGGHVLLEDYPGLAKTLIANSFASVLGMSFRRIQFTPDLLPGDITGGYMYDREQNRFVLRKGPIFANLVLADEINRASPRTQSALLEAMQERQVTLEGDTMKLPEPFIVIATQNPIEYEGTFPLPEAQLDRFIIKLSIGYPDPQEEKEIVHRRRERKQDEQELQVIAQAEDLLAMRRQVEEVYLHEDIEQYLVDITNRTRSHRQVAVGASPRGTLALLKLSRAWAAMQGRSFVLPDDVKLFVRPALSHRLILHPDLWSTPAAAERILSEIVQAVPVPVLPGGPAMRNALLLVIALILGMFILGLATLQSRLFILILPLLAYLFAAIYQRPEQVSLSVNREIFPDHAPQGTPIHITLTVTNQGAAIDELVLTELLPQGVKPTLGKSSTMTCLVPGEKFALEYTIEAARGEYNYNVSARAGDFLGFFEAGEVYPTAPHLVIYPRYPKLERIKIRPPQTRGFAGPIAARQGGTGIDFFGVREYQAGDQQRQINWKLAARSYNQLYTNIFEQERVADIGLILDARQRVDVSSPAGSLFEYSVGAAAALAENFLDDGNRVSLLLYGSGLESVYPGYGKIQHDRILRLLAKARPGMNYALESLAYLPTRFFPAKSQLILISPLEPGDISVVLQMQARGYAVLLISPDPVAYETTLYQNISSLAYRTAAAERHFMLQKVRRSGIQVVNWQVDKPLEAEVRQALNSQPLTYRAIGTGIW